MANPRLTFPTAGQYDAHLAAMAVVRESGVAGASKTVVATHGAGLDAVEQPVVS